MDERSVDLDGRIIAVVGGRLDIEQGGSGGPHDENFPFKFTLDPVHHDIVKTVRFESFLLGTEVGDDMAVAGKKRNAQGSAEVHACAFRH